MKSKKITVFTAILLLLICAGMIFFFSAQNAESSTSMSSGFITFLASIFFPDSDPDVLIAKYSHIVRKAAHFTEYAVLGGLAAAALSFIFHKLKTLPKYFISVLFSAAFAASDEYHQMFSDGRSPSVRDVMIDTCGAAVGAAVICLIAFLVRRHKEKLAVKESSEQS